MFYIIGGAKIGTRLIAGVLSVTGVASFIGIMNWM